MMLLDNERGLQQVEGESWTSWWMAPLDRLDVRTYMYLGRQKTKKKKMLVTPERQKFLN